MEQELLKIVCSRKILGNITLPGYNIRKSNNYRAILSITASVSSIYLG